MLVSEKNVIALQKIIFEEYDQELSLKEATEVANTLINYFDLLAQIYHETKN
jgi:hypothetical protein